MEKLKLEQESLNKEFAENLKKLNITKLNLISCGNSIASGFSMVRTIKPLLNRNETIRKVMHENNIDLNVYHFARAQNNNDEVFFNWLTSNTKQSSIFSNNIYDYGKGNNSMPTTNYDIKKHLEDFMIDKESDLGLLDLLSGEESAESILIYNGCTGSFLDNVTRGGKLTHQLLYGINRDCVSLSSTFKFIQNKNRNEGTNIQIYLCGAPNICGLHITDVINFKLKKIAKEYANVTYVKPVISKGIYFADGNKIPSFDIHYDEKEYMKLNNNILRSINKNYLISYAIVDIDRFMKASSEVLEFEKFDFNTCVSRFIDIWIQELSLLGVDINSFKNRLCNYFMDRAPYDFYYLDKKTIIKSLK